jgi:hypothetical protein
MASRIRLAVLSSIGGEAAPNKDGNRVYPEHKGALPFAFYLKATTS